MMVPARAKAKKRKTGRSSKSSKSAHKSARRKVAKKTRKTKKSSSPGHARKNVKRAAKKIRRMSGSGKSSKTKTSGIGTKGTGKSEKVLHTYSFESMNIPIEITIKKVPGEYVPIYDVNIAQISQTTMVVLERIRQELVDQVSLGIIDIRDIKKEGVVEERFQKTINNLIKKHFPDIQDSTRDFLTTYLIQRSLGLGHLEILNDDPFLEEIVINSSNEPVWVYQKKFGWLKTNITLETEDKIRHYASSIGRRVGKQISVLEPLLDAHLAEGDRVNATLFPISTAGNTITLRRFSRDPWTVTHMLEYKTISVDAASLIWLGIQYEMSMLIAGGTASGKTSMLNMLANFFPPNQRIISIEDTREIQLPKYLHWVPMSTRLPNVEGKGQVTMEDLLVNSLRMRPDRILVGEVRRSREAETLFEAIHTGHSCYATFHANDVRETINRLTNPPINVPKTLLPAISMIIVQFRNRRTGMRRTFQVAEINKESEAKVLKQYDARKDILQNANKSKTIMDQLALYSGHSHKELQRDLQEKQLVLKWMLKNRIKNIDHAGQIMAEYYIDPENLLSYVRKGKMFGSDPVKAKPAAVKTVAPTDAAKKILEKTSEDEEEGGKEESPEARPKSRLQKKFERRSKETKR